MKYPRTYPFGCRGGSHVTYKLLAPTARTLILCTLDGTAIHKILVVC